ncbi:outer membrane receptor protein involved in Fe transport [Maribacter vaceletii]|uniref:Outer membrane receptor protein involved in Fe transport n=1 Tax=Maribacter vaceletii TaxID=1206816 RepID=A0A495EE87_9FLAO|nr:TonB-dependent receptor [Maribacter vaceletii]RKR14207.1 outer membrane receptor protein involved in Fe transport [Maribacter vaceletii]
MRAFIFFFTLFFFSFYSLWSQTYEIRGTLVDEFSVPLEAATIYAETKNTNNLVSYTISNASGIFVLDLNTKIKGINLYISYIGFKKITKKISLFDPKLDLGEIVMESESEQLLGVDVITDRIPVIVKKDTLEFNADSFKTRPDSSLEDLLKKLPGIEVSPDGKITNNGQVVSQILINGTPFFGNDLKIATKNIPREIIDKVQITSTKTEKQKFTKQESSSTDKTINVTIKKDKNKGLIARASLGYGTENRYQVNSIANYFNGKERFSVLAGANNINNSGFSFDEVYDMIGSKNTHNVSRGNGERFNLDNISFGFEEGIITSSNVGASYVNQMKDNSDVATDYFFGASEVRNSTTVRRDNLLAENSFFSNSKSDLIGYSDSHRFNALYTFNIDSTIRISLRPKFILSQNNSDNISEEVTTDKDLNIINSSNIETSSKNNKRDFNNQFGIIKKTDSKGGFLSLNIKNAFIRDDSNLDYLSILNSSDTGIISSINQSKEIDEKVEKYNIGLAYRMPIVKNKLFLDYNLDYIITDQKNKKNVNDLNQNESQEVIFNPDLSSDFEYRSNEFQPKIGLSLQGEKYSFNINTQYRNIQLKNNDGIQNISRRSNDNYIFFGGLFRVKLSKRSALFVDYKVNNTLPSITELQPISNVINPLEIVIGNPYLKPETHKTVRLNYSGYNSKTKTSVFVFTQSEFSKNKIVTSVNTNNNFVRNTTFINVDDYYNNFGGFSITKNVKKDSIYSLKLKIGGGYVYRRNIILNNDLNFRSKLFRIIPRIGFILNYKEIFDLEPSYRFSFNNTSYNLDNLNDINFKMHSLKLRATTYWAKGLVLGNDLTYNYNGNIQGSFDKSSLFWNLSLSIEVLKGKGNLKITAYDLLKQNNNVKRTALDNYIEDRQTTILQQYFMFSFTYKFNNLRKKG